MLVLLDSDLNSRSWSQISQAILKAKLKRVSEKEALRLVLFVIERGGGIIQVEEEISRRVRRR